MFFRFHPDELPETEAKMHVGVIEVMEGPTTSVAGVFTKNALVGAPVKICRDALADKRPIRGIVTNNKISNVGVATGEEDALRICETVAKFELRMRGTPNITETEEPFTGQGGFFLPASTGVIGWRLPVDKMIEYLENELVMFNEHFISALGAARAIMTTDRYPKVASYELPCGARIVGIAKGAGMIEPNLGTMLSFILTDFEIDQTDLQAAIDDVTATTFNRISVDGDESTSDMVLALSSNKVNGSDVASFREGLASVCGELAHHVVRNGEGTNHVIRLTVSGGGDDKDFLVDLARFVVNGPLLKSAIAGNDPNVGRIVARIGQFLGDKGMDDLLSNARVSIGDTVVYEDGVIALDKHKEAAIAAHYQGAQLGPDDIGLPNATAGLDYPPHNRSVDIRVDLGPPSDGDDVVVVLGSDLTYQYVRENADYRS